MEKNKQNKLRTRTASFIFVERREDEEAVAVRP